MPPTSRILVKRDLKQARDRLTKIQEYLVRSGKLYDETHPIIYLEFCEAIAMTQSLQHRLKNLELQI